MLCLKEPRTDVLMGAVKKRRKMNDESAGLVCVESLTDK